MWFGTVKGLSLYDGNDWTGFTKDDGLAGNMVFAIAGDIDGSLWIGTDQGLTHWQQEEKIIYR